MKLLGMSFGTKLSKSPMGGTNEILIKEALMAAEETGVEVEFIRVLDYDIKPCKGCVACVMTLFQGGGGECTIKDDLNFIDEKVLESDALIIGAPVYVLGPTGLVKIVADRWGPSHDTYWRMMGKKTAQNMGKPGPDERSFKNRVAGLIVTGGATTPHWVGLGLPLMYLMCFSRHIKPIDNMVVFPGKYPSLHAGHLTLNKEVLGRARQMGRAVAAAMEKPADEAKWVGDEPGTCPICHQNLLTVIKKNFVECPICGIRGELKLVNGNIKVTFSEEEKAHSRLHIQGLKDHWDELMGGNGGVSRMMQIPNLDEVNKLKEKYIGYREVVKPAK
jgi:multimeric flavodoxin WrbA